METTIPAELLELKARLDRSVGWPLFAKECSRKILSLALSSYFAGAALGRIAMQGNPVVIGEAKTSSPFRSLRVCPLGQALREA
jgi:hypothetical protein